MLLQAKCTDMLSVVIDLVRVSILDTLKAEVQNHLDKRFLLAIGILPAATSGLSYFTLVIY